VIFSPRIFTPAALLLPLKAYGVINSPSSTAPGSPTKVIPDLGITLCLRWVPVAMVKVVPVGLAFTAAWIDSPGQTCVTAPQLALAVSEPPLWGEPVPDLGPVVASSAQAMKTQREGRAPEVPPVLCHGLVFVQ